MSEEADPTTEELQSKLDTEIANAKKLRQRAQAAEERLKDLEGKALSDDQLGEYEELKGQVKKQEQEKLEAEGNYKEALAKLKADHAKALEERDGRIVALSDALTREVGTNHLTAELGKAGVKSELLSQAAQLLAGRVKVALKDGKAVVEVLDDAGQPMRDDQGEPATIADLVEAWVPSNDHFLPPSGDTGSGSHKGAGSGTVSLAELDADPQAKAEYIQKHGREAYLKMVSENIAAKRKKAGGE